MNSFKKVTLNLQSWLGVYTIKYSNVVTFTLSLEEEKWK